MTRPPATTPPRQPYPWVVPDLFRWFFLLGLSVVGLVVAWWGTSGTAHTATQITWLNVGIAAVVIGGLGNMTWLLQGRRAVALRRRELLATLPSAARQPPASSSAEDNERVAAPGTSRYHRSDCAAVVGKTVERMPVSKHERAGRRPCGLCSGG
jgi:hypothetical protein